MRAGRARQFQDNASDSDEDLEVIWEEVEPPETAGDVGAAAGGEPGTTELRSGGAVVPHLLPRLYLVEVRSGVERVSPRKSAAAAAVAAAVAAAAAATAVPKSKTALVPPMRVP